MSLNLQVPASCLSDIYGTRFSAHLAWHRFFNLVTGDKLNCSHPCTVSSSYTAVDLSRNYTSLKQRWAQAVVLLIRTEGLLHCALLVVLRANPRSGMTTVLKKLHVPLVPRLSLWTGSAAAIQSSSPLCLNLLLPWLSLAPEFSADSHSAHVPSIGPWFWDTTSLVFSNTPCAVGVLKQGFAGEKINFQTVHRNEGVC